MHFWQHFQQISLNQFSPQHSHCIFAWNTHFCSCNWHCVSVCWPTFQRAGTAEYSSDLEIWRQSARRWGQAASHHACRLTEIVWLLIIDSTLIPKNINALFQRLSGLDVTGHNARQDSACLTCQEGIEQNNIQLLNINFKTHLNNSNTK